MESVTQIPMEEEDIGEVFQKILPFWGEKERIPTKRFISAAEPNRFILLADAYFGVVATVLYLPLMAQLGTIESEELNTQTQTNRFLYLWSNAFLVFLLIMYLYNIHSRIYCYIQGYNVVLLLLSFLALLLVGLIPFCALLWTATVYQDNDSGGTVPKSEESWITFIEATLMFLLGLSMVLVWVALKFTVNKNKVSHHEWVRILLKLVCFEIGTLAAMAFAFVIQRWALAFVYLGLFVFLFFWVKEYQLEKFKGVIRQRVHLERLLCLTDAVYAFSATLIVADLGFEGGELGEVKHGHLGSVLDEKAYEILGYIWSFLLLLMFWVLHDRLLSTVVKITPGMFWFSSLALAMIPTIPFGCKLSTSNYFVGGSMYQRESLFFINGSVTWVALMYLFCGIAVSWNPFVVKHTHIHIIYHSSPQTKYWHLQFVGTCVGIIFFSFIALVVSATQHVEAGFILSFIPLIFVILLNLWNPSFFGSVDKANFLYIQEKHHHHHHHHPHHHQQHQHQHHHRHHSPVDEEVEKQISQHKLEHETLHLQKGEERTPLLHQESCVKEERKGGAGRERGEVNEKMNYLQKENEELLSELKKKEKDIGELKKLVQSLQKKEEEINKKEKEQEGIKEV